MGDSTRKPRLDPWTLVEGQSRPYLAGLDRDSAAREVSRNDGVGGKNILPFPPLDCSHLLGKRLGQ